MKQLHSIFILFFIFLNSCTSCKNKDCTGMLQFDLPLQAYGIKDTLYLGDTLRIKLEMPEQLAERNSGSIYNFVDYNFKLITYMVKIDSLPITAKSKDTFEWITLIGESKYIGDVFLVSPTYTNNTYQYEVLITPQKRGLYVFGMNSDFSRVSPLERLDGPCSKNPVEVYMELENDTNVNFEFLKNSPDPAQANTNRQRFDEYAGFCFYVR